MRITFTIWNHNDHFQHSSNRSNKLDNIFIELCVFLSDVFGSVCLFECFKSSSLCTFAVAPIISNPLKDIEGYIKRHIHCSQS